ncbi:hypothetical protein V8B97DRAFT_1936590 [Scleroderma yunnanense]
MACFKYKSTCSTYSNSMLSRGRPPQMRSPVPPSPNTPHSAIFSSIDDELRDARRVFSQGQEEDLRYALERIIKRVEELSSLLRIAYKTQSELETQLNIAKSNLQLVISNNEMLEEALKRETPCSARDVGWRRWSAREVQNMQNTVEDRPKSLDYGPLNEPGRPALPSSATLLSVNGSRQGEALASSALQPQTPMTSQESRFFRFKLGGGLKSPPIPSHASHLTSPSLPSLISDTRERELQDLQAKYECERQAHQTVVAEKAALEAELESLSQALFEEANKMVATERIKRAETEGELQEVRKEKNALREALRLIEGENGRLRSANVTSEAVSDRIEQMPSDTSLEAGSSDPKVRVTLSPPSPEEHLNDIRDAASGNHFGVDPTSYVADLPDHLKGFALEPAPKASAVALRRTQLPVTSKANPAASIGTDEMTFSFSASFVPAIPDEPSPWGDSNGST